MGSSAKMGPILKYIMITRTAFRPCGQILKSIATILSSGAVRNGKKAGSRGNRLPVSPSLIASANRIMSLKQPVGDVIADIQQSIPSARWSSFQHEHKSGGH
jgi:hypothetical protein